MSTKQDEITKLQTFFSGQVVASRVESITEGHALIVRNGNDPYLTTAEEAEAVLHEYYPQFSVVIEGACMVIFYDKQLHGEK